MTFEESPTLEDYLDTLQPKEQGVPLWSKKRDAAIYTGLLRWYKDNDGNVNETVRRLMKKYHDRATA